MAEPLLREWLEGAGVQAGGSLEQVRPAAPRCRCCKRPSLRATHTLGSCLPPRRSPHAQEFANGYLLGQLLHCLGLQPDVSGFANSARPDACLANYAQLQVSALGACASQSPLPQLLQQLARHRCCPCTHSRRSPSWACGWTVAPRRA